jgi:hypothetical protein
MALTKAQIATLKRKAADNSLEVEHLLKITTTGDVSAVPLLAELASMHRWSHTGWEDGSRVVPFAKWVEAISVYLTDGCDGLVTYAQRAPCDSWSFALAVLESVRTPVALLAIAELAEAVHDQIDERPADAQNVVYAISNTIRAKDAPLVPEHVRVRLRDFLHAVLASSLAEAWIAIAIAALGRTGDASSVPIIANVRPLGEIWSAAPKRALREIKKRCSGPTSDA